ncbi:MAG: DUF962 domain-containing protein [Alphaproteobacteria bacterium]|nr:DUF962 domain-containing protein [Alphaproteobacteria bacterium]
MTKAYTTYEDFWPFYLSQHARRGTRALHLFGTGVAILYIGKAVFSFNPFWLLGAAFMGYFFAWIGHFFIEKNRPATFSYPLWSLRGDFHMFYLWATGRLGDELRKHGLG